MNDRRRRRFFGRPPPPPTTATLGGIIAVDATATATANPTAAATEPRASSLPAASVPSFRCALVSCRREYRARDNFPFVFVRLGFLFFYGVYHSLRVQQLKSNRQRYYSGIPFSYLYFDSEVKTDNSVKILKT